MSISANDRLTIEAELKALLGADVDNITRPEDIEAAFEKLSCEQRKVKERLEWSVSNRHHIEAKLAQVAALQPAVAGAAGDARTLAAAVAATHVLAARVAGRVRRLDEAKRAVVDVQSRVGDLLDLEGCAGGVCAAMAQGDYETAAAHIHRFLSMDASVLLSTASPGPAGGQSIEGWFAKLREAEAELAAGIEARFDEAVALKDSASVDRFFKLFPLLERKELGLTKFSAFLCAKIREAADAALQAAPARPALAWADAAARLLEAAAALVDGRQPLVETYYGPGRLVAVAWEVVAEADRQMGRLLDAMRRGRGLDALLADVGAALSQPSPASPSPRSLDPLLTELTLLTARADLFLRFMRRRLLADLRAGAEEAEVAEQEAAACRRLSRCQLACDVAAVVAQYSILEQYYLCSTFERAVALAKDTPADSSEGAPVSSIVDDAFFIIKKSVRRAIAGSSVDGVCATLNHAVALIDTQLAEPFHATLRRGFPAHGYIDISQAYTALQTSLQTGKINSGSAEADSLRLAFLTALNNAETSGAHALSLAASLKTAIEATVSSVGDTGQDKLSSCLADLEASGRRLADVAAFGVRQLTATAVRPRVRAWMATYGAQGHHTTEEELACSSASSGFAEEVAAGAGALLEGLQPALTAANHRAVAAALTAELALAMEAQMLKTTYNRLGGLRCDKDVRGLVAYLSAAADWAHRDRLTRLRQLATLLNLESLSEVSEYTGSASWKLSPKDMRKVLALRVDFKVEDIKRLKL